LGEREGYGYKEGDIEKNILGKIEGKRERDVRRVNEIEIGREIERKIDMGMDTKIERERQRDKCR
jgi:hypothetical protein